jgi:hypothetical protein
MNKTNTTLIRLVSSKLFALLGIPTWGVGSIPPPCDDQAKDDDDLANLIQCSKVSYAQGLRDAWDNRKIF